MSDPSTATKTFTRERARDRRLRASDRHDVGLGSRFHRADQWRDPPDGGSGVQLDRRRPARRRPRGAGAAPPSHFEQLLMVDGRYVMELQVKQIVDFLAEQLKVTADGPLAGRVTIVTGASSGIGRDTCISLARAGAVPVLVGRDASRLAETAAAVIEAGRGPAAAAAPRRDLRESTWRAWPPRRWSDTVASTSWCTPRASCAPRVDAANGRAAQRPEWDEVVDTNLRGTYLANRAVLPAMLGAGRGDILNVSSKSGRQGIATTRRTAPRSSASSASARRSPRKSPPPACASRRWRPAGSTPRCFARPVRCPHRAASRPDRGSPT